MPYEHRFEQSPTVVFEAVVHAIRQLEKLGAIDRDALTIAFATKVSGWSWGSQWVAQLTPDGAGTFATASMRSAGSLVAGLSEKKKIDRIWAAATAQMPKPQGSDASAGGDSGPGTSEAVGRLYGSLLADERFGGRRVRIFENGYAQISGLGPGAYRKLLRIEEDFVIQKKTGPGRAVAGVATMGTNFLVTGNKRGDLYLSIVTDAGAETLRESPPTNDGVRRGTSLALAGRAAIDQAAAQSRQTAPAAAPSPAAISESIEDRLARAQDLADQGIITVEEHAATRANILKNI